MDFVHLIREVKALARMNHPNIVRYFSAWVEPERVGGFEEPDTEEAGFAEDEQDDDPQDGPCLYIQQELCHSSLKELLRVAAPLAKEVAWKIFEQIIRGLHYVHGNKVRHGNLSPANVFLDDNKDVKIGDFGLASLNEGGLLSENSPRAEGFHTTPEVKEGSYSLSSDMYSVGIMLFEMFSVFQSSMERHQVLTNLATNKEFPVDYTLPPATLNLVQQLIDDLPTDRPTTEFILEDEPWR